MTGVNKKAQVTQITQETLKVILNQVVCIYYPVQFRKNKEETIQALINSGNKVNIIALAYTAKLGLMVCSINIGA